MSFDITGIKPLYKNVKVRPDGTMVSCNTSASHPVLPYKIGEFTKAPIGSQGVFTYLNLEDAKKALIADKKFRAGLPGATLEVIPVGFVNPAYTTRKDNKKMAVVPAVYVSKVAYREPTEYDITNDVWAEFVGSSKDDKDGFKRIKLYTEAENGDKVQVATLGANGLVEVKEGFKVLINRLTKADWMKVYRIS